MDAANCSSRLGPTRPQLATTESQFTPTAARTIEILRERSKISGLVRESIHNGLRAEAPFGNHVDISQIELPIDEVLPTPCRPCSAHGPGCSGQRSSR